MAALRLSRLSRSMSNSSPSPAIMGPQEKPRLLPIPMGSSLASTLGPLPLVPFASLKSQLFLESDLPALHALLSPSSPFRRQIWQQPHEHVAASVAALGQPAAAIGCGGSIERELGRADCRFGSGTVRVCRCRRRIYLHAVTCAAVQYLLRQPPAERERGTECSWGFTIHQGTRDGTAVQHYSSVTA